MSIDERSAMDAARRTDLEVTRLAPALGAEVRGLRLADLASEPDDDSIAAIEQLLLEHMVLFFPDQHLSVDEHVAFGRRMAERAGGELEAHPNLKNAFTEHPEIFELAASKGGIADEWHTDLTFQESPSLMSILNMVECPDVGGDTMWANLCLAYDGLSAPMRDLIDGLTALHDAQAHGRPEKTAIHPVVRVHPLTGRKALYVNEHFTRRIVELSHHESAPLLDMLTTWVSEERHTVRYRWTKGTIAVWDNRCTQHHVLNDFVGERIIHRVTITGDHPAGDPERSLPQWEPSVQRGAATGRFDYQLARHLRDH